MKRRQEFHSKRLGRHYYNVTAQNKKLAVLVAAARLTKDNERLFSNQELRIERPKLVKCEKRIRDLATLFS